MINKNIIQLNPIDSFRKTITGIEFKDNFKQWLKMNRFDFEEKLKDPSLNTETRRGIGVEDINTDTFNIIKLCGTSPRDVEFWICVNTLKGQIDYYFIHFVDVASNIIYSSKFIKHCNLKVEPILTKQIRFIPYVTFSNILKLENFFKI